MNVENKKKLFDLYKDLVKNFFVLNNIKEVTCTDEKEHFFDRVLIDNDGNMRVYNHGYTSFWWSNLLFDFTVDYATCLAKMEHDLYLQERNGEHKNYTFVFNEKYVKPILLSIV
jgi:hypothetical protein